MLPAVRPTSAPSWSQQTRDRKNISDPAAITKTCQLGSQILGRKHIERNRTHMEPRFEAATLAAIADQVHDHLATLPAAIDSFLEDQILASNHYRVVLDGEPAGFASVHGEGLITQFALDDRFRVHGQRVFRAARRLEQVREALVPACDNFFLSHALDEYRTLAMQAHFFATAPSRRTRPAPERGTLRLALPSDRDEIRDGSGDFFGDIDRFIAQESLFLLVRDGTVAGYGLMEVSSLQDGVASIGMFTREEFRRQGVGSATISLLMEVCDRRGVRPIAGCWYYNHNSRRTLERAGMYPATRLLRVGF